MSPHNETFQQHFSEPIESVEDLQHKGNNRLYKVALPGVTRLLKQYATEQIDNWDRAGTEYRAMNYLWNVAGFRNIPEPISHHPEQAVAVYSYETGTPLTPETVMDKDIIAMADFLANVHTLEQDKGQFPEERTRCLSVRAYVDMLDERINRIKQTFTDDYTNGEGKAFLEGPIKETMQELKTTLEQSSYPLDEELPLAAQVLTPGDFGPHNVILRSSDKQYIFHDFEYAGRDDPVKQVLDFVHHARSKAISKELKETFIARYLEQTNHPNTFQERMHLVDPLIGMNWVLIYMGVFSKPYLDQMRHSHQEENLQATVQQRFERAKRKLQDLRFFTHGENLK